MKIFLIKLKPLNVLKKEIEDENKGWWIDSYPNNFIEVREATQSDIERCLLKQGATINSLDYYCENKRTGALILKKAVESVEDYNKANPLFLIKLKSKKVLRREISEIDMGWWIDSYPINFIEVREATQEDIQRCYLRDGATKQPKDYYCENIERGALILKKAVGVVKQVKNSPQ